MLIAGTRLGAYEVVATLGAGGMGEVYRARDTKLGRDVAIKILLDAVAADPDRVARFEREAKVLASLNHSNIAALFGMDQADGRHFLIMELVEGQTLAERLEAGGSGPGSHQSPATSRQTLPLDQALNIAMQMAEALEAAHEKGIVHRDLKPANVKITPDEKVKVLDFGLAKAMEADAASRAGGVAGLSLSPTLSLMATQAGMILGTAAYMSPEQAKGLPADHRSDVFSFGVVLYEMLTGRQPFRGETAPDILASVLARDPELNALPQNLNPRLHDLVRRCLEKTPRRRWQAIGDVRAELEIIAANPQATPAPLAQTAVAPRPLWRRALPIALTALAAVSLTGVAAWVLRPAPAPPSVTRFPIVFPDDQLVGPSANSLMAIAPDGSAIVTSAVRELRLRRMADMEARALAIGEAAVAPFFSPDGQWIGFSSPRDFALKKIAITGGVAVTICKTAGVAQGTLWEGDHIYYVESEKGIMRVSADGGEPEVVIPLKLPEAADTPQVLDHGKAILFTLATEAGSDRWDKAQVVVQPLPSGARKVILRGGSNARYAASGHLLFVRQGTLLAVPFDLKTLQTRGGPVPVVEGLMRAANPAARSGQMNVAVSASGTLAYIPGAATSSSAIEQLRLVDRTGKAETLPLSPAAYSHPRFSPNGKQLVYATDEAGDGIIWVYEVTGGAPPRRLTFVGRNSLPVWTPDGRRITFRSVHDGSDSGIYSQSADGTGVAERLIESGAADLRPEAWTPDGKTLAFLDGRGAGDIFTLTLGGDQKPKPLVQSPANERYAAFSPDGRWLAYSASQRADTGTGGFRVYVEPFPPTGAKYELPAENSRNLVWAPDGRQAFYFQPGASQASGRLVAVDFRTQPSFSFGKPTPLPIEGAVAVANGTNYDIAPDGKRFVLVMPAGETTGLNKRPPAQINVALNWIEELKQRVPTR